MWLWCKSPSSVLKSEWNWGFIQSVSRLLWDLGHCLHRALGFSSQRGQCCQESQCSRGRVGQHCSASQWPTCTLLGVVATAHQLKLPKERRCQAGSGAAEQRSSFVRRSTLQISDVAFLFWEHCFAEKMASFPLPSCAERIIFVLFSFFPFILCLLLSRAGTALAVPHNQPSEQYSLLCENQCLINPGCPDVVVVFFFLTLLADSQYHTGNHWVSLYLSSPLIRKNFSLWHSKEFFWVFFFVKYREGISPLMCNITLESNFILCACSPRTLMFNSVWKAYSNNGEYIFFNFF